MRRAQLKEGVMRVIQESRKWLRDTGKVTTSHVGRDTCSPWIPVLRRTARRSAFAAAVLAIGLIVILSGLASADEHTPVSCNVVSQDVRTVIKDLAAQAGVNVLIDDSIQKRVTLFLDNVPFSDALRILASSVGCITSQDSGVFLILPGPGIPGISQPAQGLRPSALPEDTASIVLETGSLSPEVVCDIVTTLGADLVPTPFPDLGIVVVTGPYSKVNSARTALAPWLSKLPADAEHDEAVRAVRLDHLDIQNALSSFAFQFPGVKVAAIRGTRFVLLSGREEDVQRAVVALEALDVPPKVVKIDVEIIEVLREDLSNLGVGWKGPLGEPGLRVMWTEASPQPTSGGTVGPDGVGQIELRPWIRSSLSLVTELNLLVEKGKAKVVARPSLTTVEDRPARIMTGDRYTIILTEGQGSSTWQRIQYIDAGVRLEITPTVGESGEITAVICPQVSAVTGMTKEGYPRISTREAQTTVRVKDGETIAIGGLIQTQEVSTKYGFPLLGDIPVIGRLFSTTRTSSEATELVILVTLKVAGQDPGGLDQTTSQVELP